MIRSELKLLHSIFSLCIFSPFSLSKTQNTNKPVHYGNMKADLIMRNYFRNRSEMSNIMMIDLFDQLKTVKVGSAFFNDHRWIHLNVLIQKNLINFSITEQLKLLQALTRLNHFNELFNSLFVNLIGKLDTLQPNQKAALFYFKAKRGKTNAQLVKRLSDSIIISLKSPSLKITFPKQYHKSKAEKDSQQQQQQLFPDTSNQVQQISCRNLILCFWSLQKMKIKDSLLTNCILKQIIKPRIQEIPASLFPLLLSSLWLHGMEHKRIYAEITFQLKKRESELTLLDRDKVKMLICMLCKPEISPITQSKQKQAQSPQRKQQKLKLSETRKILVLWLMQNMIIKHEDKLQKQEILLSTTAYQILTNASEAKIIDIELYQKYLSIIAQDLIKIQTKQVVYLLSIIQRIRNYSRMNNRTNEIQNICSKEHKILSQHLQRNLFGFLQKINEDHPARALLRKMVLSSFIEIPKVFKKKLVHEENILKNKRAFSSRNQSTAEHKKQQSNQTKNSTPKRGSRRQSQKKVPKSETQQK